MRVLLTEAERHVNVEDLTTRRSGLSLFRPLIFCLAGCIMVPDRRHRVMVFFIVTEDSHEMD
jgi:hypothetical protein